VLQPGIALELAMHRCCALALTGLLLVASCVRASAADVTVFGAASLADALNEIAKDYEKDKGRSVAVSPAASSALAHQIEASGGADLFICADLDWMDYLDRKGLIAHDSRINLLGNRLVLVAARNTNTKLVIGRGFDLAGALQGGRLSMADPDSVPAGKYGRAALMALGVWKRVAGHLVNAENVRVALSYVARGEAPLGVVYETDAKAEPGVKIVGVFPENSHPPILYPAALTKDAAPAARDFLAYLSSPTARAVFLKDGFSVLVK
jgi:molybdate transport system substrate-binding protein